MSNLKEYLCFNCIYGGLPYGYMSKDYKHLKELLDHGEKVVVLVQILPPRNRKYHILATTGIDKGRKYYSIGYGYVFTDDAFFRQCEALELEYIELRGQ